VNEIQAHVMDTPQVNGNGVQDIVALATKLTMRGFTTQQVQAVMLRIRSVAEQVTVNMMNEILSEMENLQRARIARLTQLISLLPAMGPYVRRDAVLMAINTVINETPQQER
jgi:hypothetical protein